MPNKNLVKLKQLYLLASIISLIATLYFCIPLAPIILKLFVKYPGLSEARQLNGVIEVIGEYSAHKGPAKYFIKTQTGVVEIYCGLPTRRLSCFGSDRWVNGAKGTVWFHNTFGLLQWDLTLTKIQPDSDVAQLPNMTKREIDKMPYLVQKNLFENKFDFHNYSERLLLFLISLGVTFFNALKYRFLKKSTSNHFDKASGVA